MTQNLSPQCNAMPAQTTVPLDDMLSLSEDEETDESSPVKSTSKYAEFHHKLRNWRDYSEENIVYVRESFENRMKQSTMDDILHDNIDSLQATSTQHTQLNLLAKTKEFETPEEIDLTDPKVWHKRLSTPFLEDQVDKFYKRKLKKIDTARFYGLNLKEKHLWTDYKMFVQFNRVGPQLYTKVNIRKLRSVDIRFYRQIRYSVFRITRMNHERQEFTEADLSDINPNDVDWLYHELNRKEKKTAKERYAFECLIRFMKGQVNMATVSDFQIALEGGRGRVNLTEPTRFFKIQDMRLWSILDLRESGIGIIYSSPYWDTNLVMLFNEVHKFSSGSLCKISEEVKGIIEKGDANTGDSSLLSWKINRANYSRCLEEIEDCLAHRRLIRKYESYLKIRTNPYSDFAHQQAGWKRAQEAAKAITKELEMGQSSAQVEE